MLRDNFYGTGSNKYIESCTFYWCLHLLVLASLVTSAPKFSFKPTKAVDETWGCWAAPLFGHGGASPLNLSVLSRKGKAVESQAMITVHVHWIKVYGRSGSVGCQGKCEDFRGNYVLSLSFVFLEHPFLGYLGISPARQHEEMCFRKAHIKKYLKWPKCRTNILAAQLMLLSACRLENKERTCKRSKNNLGIANQVRSDVSAARILRAVEKNRIRLENVCPSCMTDVGEDVIICYFSFLLWKQQQQWAGRHSEMQLAKVMGVESLTFCDGNLIWKKGLLIISPSNQVWEMSWSCFLICMPTDLIWKPNHSEILGRQQKCYKQGAVLSERSAGCQLLFFTPVAWSLLHDSMFLLAG